MKTTKNHILNITCALTIGSSLVCAGEDTGKTLNDRQKSYENNREVNPDFVRERDVINPDRKANTFAYTKCENTLAGGITGQVMQSAELVLAAATGEPNKLYRAVIDNTTGTFLFKGLPVGRYDILVFDGNFCYEGITLSRENTLTDLDREQISQTIMKSEPFYPNKTLWRIEGQTGQGNEAQVIASFYHPKGTAIDPFAGDVIQDLWKRNVKIISLKYVGAGWQITNSRACNSDWIMKDSSEFIHRFVPSALSKIRVTDEIKNIGKLDLSSLTR